jgi:hypothetical protein
MKSIIFNWNKGSKDKMSERILFSNWKHISGFFKLFFFRVRVNHLRSMAIFLAVPKEINTFGNSTIGYLTGPVIALFIMGFLFYSLLKHK